MNKQLINTIRQDFLDWTGGFRPESEEEIALYVEAASPIATNDEEVRTLLLDWMEQGIPSEQRE